MSNSWVCCALIHFTVFLQLLKVKPIFRKMIWMWTPAALLRHVKCQCLSSSCPCLSSLQGSSHPFSTLWNLSIEIDSTFCFWFFLHGSSHEIVSQGKCWHVVDDFWYYSPSNERGSLCIHTLLPYRLILCFFHCCSRDGPSAFPFDTDTDRCLWRSLC